jgi:TPP-dependent pyruvate/acetoin dehydrogenase alpha subunit
MDAEILAAIEDAVKFSEESPFPDPDAAVEDVFAE